MLSQRIDALQDRKIAFIVPASVTSLDHIFAPDAIVEQERIKDVFFGDKRDWTTTGDKGFGLTVAKVVH